MIFLRYLWFFLLTTVLCVHADETPPAYLPLQTLTNLFADTSLTATNSVTVWQSPDVNIRFFENSRRIEINGTLLWLNGAIITNETEQPMIAEKDIYTVLRPLLAPSSPVAPSNTFVVILDPGHGGDDSGATVPDALPEKTLTLEVAKRVQRRLQAEGITVRMTRGSNRTLTLANRTEFAKRRQGSVLVSIHVNKASNEYAQGIETFVLPAAGFPSTSAIEPVVEAHPGNLQDAASTQLAFFIHRELIEQMQAVDRGVKRARYEVLRNTPCPATLVEIGFLSNPDELKNLQDPDYQERLAESIAFGIYLYRLQNRRGDDL